MIDLLLLVLSYVWEHEPDDISVWIRCGPFDTACPTTTTHRKFGIKYRVDYGYTPNPSPFIVK